MPESITGKIPSIAYYIPDLEATVVVRIQDTATDTQAACLFVRLSNGLTVKHDYITWAVSALVILAFLYSTLHYIIGPFEDSLTGPDYRLMTLVTWFQFIVTTGVLSVNYPQVFISFTRNFAAYWGLIYIRPIQHALSDTVESTGGSNLSPQSATDISSTLRGLLSGIGDALDPFTTNAVRSDGALTVPKVAEQRLDPHEGIDEFVQEQGLATGTTFSVALINFLFLAAILIVIVVVVCIVLAIRNCVSRTTPTGTKRISLGSDMTSFAFATALKLVSWLEAISTI